mgnify:CR=1 FL=1
MLKRVGTVALGIILFSTLMFAAEDRDTTPVSVLEDCRLARIWYAPERDLETILYLCQILEGTDPFPTESPASVMSSSRPDFQKLFPERPTPSSLAYYASVSPTPNP